VNGYGQVSFGPRGKAKNYLAHRVVYIHFKGAIPDGFQPDHLCRNPKCVNPSHLEAVTQAENVRRQSNVKLNFRSVSNIRRLLHNGHAGADIARRYGVCQSTICHIKKGRRWAE
jgi:hypothetical protein